MKCPNHPNKDLPKEDFYWHKDTGTLKNQLCKKCIAKKNKDKYESKKDFYKMFAV